MRLAIVSGIGLVGGFGGMHGGLHGTVAPVNYTPATNYTPNQIAAMVSQAAQAQGVPVDLALSIVAHESAFNPNATYYNPPTAAHPAGTYDYGVMALNESTVQTLGVTNPYDPQQNIDAGVGLLASLMQKYNGNEAQVIQSYATGSANSAPSPTVQTIINWVTTDNPSKDAVLTRVGVDPNTFAVTDSSGNTIVAGNVDTGGTMDSSSLDASGTATYDSSSALDTGAGTDWTTVGLLVAAGIVALALF